jgi:hypothetical protein
MTIETTLTLANHPTLLFQHALELVEALPEAQQEDLLQIIRQRSLARRRQALVESIEQARQERARGEVQRGNVDDLLAEVDE